MDPFTAIMGLAGLFTTLMTVTKGITDSQKADETSKTTTDLAKENLQLQKDSASQNLAMQKEQFEYQKQLNNLQMEREDTAFQRQVKDLQAAGLSPLMVAGNGASATPLTSATAPQLDTSGINQAIQNAVGAYNDSFNRHIQARQFSLQSKVQAAQAFTQLAEFKLQKKKADLENQYLNEKMKWEKVHGFRDLSWTSELTNIIETLIGLNTNSVGNGLQPPVVEKVQEVKDFLDEKATAPDNNDFGSFGSVPKYSSYGHLLDNENYDNERSTFNLLKEEANEKKQKIDLRIKDNEKNRINLYNADDYLKKHISKDNWIKANKEFIKYYLKYGHFEGHKTYFD